MPSLTKTIKNTVAILMRQPYFLIMEYKQLLRLCNYIKTVKKWLCLEKDFQKLYHLKKYTTAWKKEGRVQYWDCMKWTLIWRLLNCRQIFIAFLIKWTISKLLSYFYIFYIFLYILILLLHQTGQYFTEIVCLIASYDKRKSYVYG